MTDKSPETLRVTGAVPCPGPCSRIALANQLAAAAEETVHELRKQFPRHPLVLAWDAYAEAATVAPIREAMAELSDIDLEVERRR